MKYELAIFDFDGTLADSLAWFAGVLDEVAVRFDFKRVGGAELELLRTLDTRAILRHLGVPMWKMPMIATHMRSLIARDAHTLSLFDGVEGALERLAADGVRIGIVSSNSAENIRRILGPRASALVGDYECGASLFGKPSKLKKLLRRAGVAAGRAIYVGDELRDVHAARSVGLAFGAVSWGYNTAEALRAAGPDLLFATVEELHGKLI